MCVKDRIQIIFCSVLQISEELGADSGKIYNSKNEQSQAPQESPEGAWKVLISGESKEIREQYNASENGWVIDTSLKVTVIEW